GTLFEAIPPMSTWGRSFLCRLHAPRLPGYYNIGDHPFDIIRVLAGSNNTLVTINGMPWTTLASGQYRDTAISDIFAIETSQPVLVAQFDHQKYAGDLTGGPDMAIVSPLEQRTNDLRFFSSHDFEDFADTAERYNDHYMVISGDQSIRNTITFDGAPLPDTGFVNIATILNGENLVIGSYAIDSGFHHISTSSPKGLTLLVYGGGDGFGYAYGIGSLTVPKSDLSSSIAPSNSLSLQPPYPNPTDGNSVIVTIGGGDVQSVRGVTTLTMFDVLGREVYHENIPAGISQVELPIRNLSEGIYYIQLATSTGSLTQKFVKSK
ncbi:MAG: T9SS type A sorting domain-containing protein, partial [Bacteroidota bacterium]|nr:T9SS type A sorting domain-containing protein [Bacteroidota bacterium]